MVRGVAALPDGRTAVAGTPDRARLGARPTGASLPLRASKVIGMAWNLRSASAKCAHVWQDDTNCPPHDLGGTITQSSIGTHRSTETGHPVALASAVSELDRRDPDSDLAHATSTTFLPSGAKQRKISQAVRVRCRGRESEKLLAMRANRRMPVLFLVVVPAGCNRYEAVGPMVPEGRAAVTPPVASGMA